MKRLLFASGVVVLLAVVPCASPLAANVEERQAFRVLFARSESTPRVPGNNLYIVSADGRGLAKLATDASGGEQYAVSADGRRIAYKRQHWVRNNPDGTVAAERPDDVVVMDTDGTHVRSTGLREVDVHGWTTGGRLLLLHDWKNWDDRRERLFDVDAGRFVASVGPGGCCDAVGWSPSHKEFAGVIGLADGQNGIVLVQVASRKWRWLYRGEVGFDDPVWSPDAQKIAFTLSGDNVRSDAEPLALISVRTGKLTRLPGTVGGEGAVLAWAPGPRLVFTRVVGKARTALFSWDGNRTSRLPLTGLSADPHWSPDGRSLAFRWSGFASSYDESDIAVLREGRARRITPLGVDGAFTFVGWSQGQALPTATPLTAMPLLARATLRTARAGPLDARDGRVASAEPFGSVVLWQPADNRRLTLKSTFGYGEGIQEVALSQSHVAWVIRWVDRSYGQDCLLLAAFGSGLLPIGDARCGEGKELQAYLTWSPGSIESIIGGQGSIAYSARDHSSRPYEVFVVERAASRKVLVGARLLAYDDGKLVVRRGSAVDIVGTDGRSTRLEGSVPAEAHLSGDTLVAVGADGAVRVYDARRGSLTRTLRLLPVPVDRPRLEDAAAGFAAVVVDGQLRVVRLTDGRSVRIALAGAVAPIHARLMGRRLVVSYNALGGSPYGRVVVTPLAVVTEALARA